MKEIQYLSYLGYVSLYRHLKEGENVIPGEYRINFRRVHVPTGQSSKFSVAVLKQSDMLKLLDSWNSMPEHWEYSIVSVMCV
jgi:hypothetical protein